MINFDGGSASAAAQLDAFFNVLPGNYNLNLDIITATKQMASVKIDRTDKPFEAGVLYKKEVGTLTLRHPCPVARLARSGHRRHA